MITLDFGGTISVKYEDENRYTSDSITDFCFYLQKKIDMTFPNSIYYLPNEQAILDDKNGFYYVSGPTTYSFSKKYLNSEFSLLIDVEKKYFHFIYGPMLNQQLKEIIASYIIRHSISLLQMRMNYFFAFSQDDYEKLKEHSQSILPQTITCNGITFTRISKFGPDFFETGKEELYSIYQSEVIKTNPKTAISLCYNNELFNTINPEKVIKEEK